MLTATQNKPKSRTQKRLYTFADYLTWNDGQRYEIIKGRKIMMSPAPLPTHQLIAMDLSGIFWSYINQNNLNCGVMQSPVDVRLCKTPNDEECYNVFQPDIVILCDLSKIDNRGILGAPDLVVEILSPSTAQRDMIEKYEIYQQYSVKEYWIVSPEYRTVTVYLHDGDRFQQRGIYGKNHQIPVKLFDDNLQVSVAQVFAKLDLIKKRSN